MTAIIMNSPVRLFVYTACIAPPFVCRSVRSNNRVLQYSQSDWILRESSGGASVLFGYGLFGPDVHTAQAHLEVARCMLAKELLLRVKECLQLRRHTRWLVRLPRSFLARAVGRQSRLK